MTQSPHNGKEKPLRILHIIPTYYPAFRHGGPIESVHALNRALATLGEKVTVYTTDINGSERLNVPCGEPVDVNGVTVFYFPVFFRPWEYSWEMHKALAKMVKKQNFDIVHITSTFRAASALGAYYAKKNNVPYIISPRGNLMREPLGMKSPLKKKLYLWLVEKRILRGASAIHFTVEKEKMEYLEAGLPLKRPLVIPNSFYRFEWGDDFKEKQREQRNAFRAKYSIGAEEEAILFLGRISWKKGFDTLIPAFAELVRKDPQALLVIAGGDEEGYRKTVEEFIREHGIENRVLFTGLVAEDEKRAALAAADCFVLPSYSENFGMAVVEAMYAGLPVVVSENVGIASLITKHDAGIVIKKDTDALIRALQRLMRDSDQAHRMGLRGKELVRREFLPEKVAKEFLEEYRFLVRQSRRVI